MSTLEQITQALLDAQQTMGAMRQQLDAELRVMTVSSHEGSETADEMAAALEQITQAMLDAQQTMSAMRQQFDAELRVMNADCGKKEYGRRRARKYPLASHCMRLRRHMLVSRAFLAWAEMPARLRAHWRLLRKPMLVSRASWRGRAGCPRGWWLRRRRG
jgi:hypothetical protein